MTFREVLESRYSVRKVAPDPVPADKLAAVLEAVRVAPSAKNLQPVRFRLFTSPEELALVDACTPCRYGAPAVLLFCYDDEVAWKKEGRPDAGPVDVSIACTYAMLEAANQGLGSVWVMNADCAKLRELLRLPPRIVPICLLPFGFAAADAAPGPNHAARRPLESMRLREEA